MSVSGDFPLSERAAEALKFINTTGAPIFLTGKAGTGKTTFLRALASRTHKRMIVVAPTGIAALNAGGVTIHSQFRLPMGMYIPDKRLPDGMFTGGNYFNDRLLAEKSPLDRIRRQTLRSIDLLVIDEVSMLRADLLDAVDYRLKSARGNFGRPFGGVQVLFIGDLFQLPPVIKREDETVLSNFYSSPWFFDARALLQERLVCIELDHIYRQRDDRFIGLLNHLRNNEMTADDMEVINSCYRPDVSLQEMRDTITLTTHNHQADEINRQALEELSGSPHIFNAKVNGDFPESMYPVASRLELKAGAQIMFTKNDLESKSYYNGRRARVQEITAEGVLVTFHDDNTDYTLRRTTWENKRYQVDPQTQAVNEEVIGTFEHFPIRLAWAITIHKSQGLTFDRAVIDPGRAFADGQVYVALSRLRTLEGLILRTPLRSHAISTDTKVVKFSRNALTDEEIGETATRKQREFIGQLLIRAFDFEPLVNELERLNRHDASDQPEETTFKRFPQQLADGLLTERDNTLRFRQQLLTLLDQDRLGELDERLIKGSEYYREFLWTRVEQLLHHSAVTGAKGKGQSYLAKLDEIDQHLMLRIGEIEKSRHLIRTILSGTDTFDFKVLETVRLERRIKLIQEIRRNVGPEVTQKPARTKRTRGQSQETSISSFLEGRSVNQIAQERGLTTETIYNHLAPAVIDGRIPTEALLPAELRLSIDCALDAFQQEGLAQVLLALKGRVSPSLVRLVMTLRRNTQT